MEVVMQIIALFAFGAALLTGPALAQSTQGTGSIPPPNDTAGESANQPSRSTDQSIDRGPNTPEANRAHRGGGAILEGAPGAPAPMPQPTPPAPNASVGEPLSNDGVASGSRRRE
jgi:hypothetical protein